MQVKVVSDRVTVVLNGVTTAENVILENACNREIPAYAEGQILLIAGNAPLNVREMYIRELPATPRFELSEEELPTASRCSSTVRRCTSGPGTPPTTSPSTERST